MRQSIKRLIIVVLTLVFMSFLNSGTVSAHSDKISEKLNADAGTPVAQITEIPLSAVFTSTPDEDGIIIHEVQYGETLFTIAEAYGVPIDQILTNSSLSLTTTDIREGQTLVIQKATEPTATPSPTATIDPGTPTPTQVRPTRTPFPTRTPAPTSTPTRPPSIIHRALGNGIYFGIGLILISGLGLILVLYRGFLKKS
jgi:LysM repeat protein